MKLGETQHFLSALVVNGRYVSSANLTTVLHTPPTREQQLVVVVVVIRHPRNCCFEEYCSVSPPSPPPPSSSADSLLIYYYYCTLHCTPSSGRCFIQESWYNHSTESIIKERMSIVLGLLASAALVTLGAEAWPIKTIDESNSGADCEPRMLRCCCYLRLRAIELLPHVFELRRVLLYWLLWRSMFSVVCGGNI